VPPWDPRGDRPGPTSADGQPFGAVQQQAAAAMQQAVEAALFHVDVAQAAAEQVGPLTSGELGHDRS
jgi:hypothetical protein